MNPHHGVAGSTLHGDRARLVYASAAVVLLSSLVWTLAQEAPAPPSGGSDKAGAVSNPHWTRDQCAACHTEVDDEIAPVAPESVDAICLRCHDGIKASMEEHPIGRLARTDRAKTPADWPAPNDRLGCITCHDPLLAGEHSAEDRGGNPAFLRGDPGVGLIAFCNICHESAAATRFNPHRMLTAEGRPDPERCSFCHAGEMPPDAIRRRGDSKLIGDEITLCAGCHLRHPDYFEPGHIGVALSPAMLKEFHRPQSPAAQLLPPGPENKVVCSTCHNPHQHGLFAEGSALGSGALRLDSGQSLPNVRVQSSSFCAVCHFR